MHVSVLLPKGDSLHYRNPCLVGARLILIVHMICCNTSAPIDNFAYLLLLLILFFRYNTVKHELSFLKPVKHELSFLKPVEFIYPAKICMVLPITMKDEIIF